jgi:uncharacterized protein YcnI
MVVAERSEKADQNGYPQTVNKEVCRMRAAWFRIGLLSTFLTLAVTGVASAHVVVSPEEVPADSYEKLTVSVPTEREVPTTQIRVEVPEGFTVLGVRPMPGWDYEFEEDADEIRAITWSGGEIAPREFQEFTVQAKTPQEGGEFAWNAFQTYESGEVVEWTGSEDSEEPASVVRVGSGGAEGDEHGDRGEVTPEPSSEDLSSTGEITPIAAYSGLGVGVLALVVALVALLRGR